MVGEKYLTVKASPHVRTTITTPGIMLDVVLSLIPALIASTIIFGLRVLAICAVTIGTAILSEYLARKIMKRSNTLGDLSAVVTGLILAFNLPVSIPLWMAAFGSLVAIVVVKQMFGGVGQNFINPAIAGRIVLTASFPTAMSAWTQPRVLEHTDALTGASPLMDLRNGAEQLPSLTQMFLGVRMGSLGEVCALALLLGGAYLLFRRVITLAIPLSFIGTVALVMLIAKRGDFEAVAYQLLAGGLLLGAIFMATDYSTSPISQKGKIIFGIGCGLITCLIRLFGSLPEGVSFSIIIMNILVPHIENLTLPRPFGAVKEKRKKEEGKA